MGGGCLAFRGELTETRETRETREKREKRETRETREMREMRETRETGCEVYDQFCETFTLNIETECRLNVD